MVPEPNTWFVVLFWSVVVASTALIVYTTYVLIADHVDMRRTTPRRSMINDQLNHLPDVTHRDH